MPFLGGGASGAAFSGVAGPLGGAFFPPPPPRIATGLSITQPWPNLGRFRRHLSGNSVDGFGAALAAVTLLIYDWTTKLLVASLTTDAAGYFDYPIYAEGTTYFYYFNKAGAVEVFTTSSNQLVPV